MKRKHFSRTLRRGWKRFKRFAGQAAGAAVSTGFQWAGNGSRTGTVGRNGRAAEYGNITFQNDEHRLYRRKRAPRRVRKLHKRAFKRFNYMLDKCQGMKTVLIPRTSAMTNTPTNGSTAQVVRGITLYGFGDNSTTPGTNNNWDNGDLRYIFTANNNVAPATSLATTKLRFRSAVMNLTIKNTATSDASYRDGLCFIDLYHVIARKDGNSPAGTTSGSPATLWSQMIDLQDTLPAGTIVADNMADGVTPFDAPGFGSLYVIKSSRRVRLSIGQTFSTQIRDPGNYIITEEDLMTKTHGANLTEGYIIVAYNPSADTSTGIRGAVSLEINTTKVYHYAATLSTTDTITRSNLI